MRRVPIRIPIRVKLAAALAVPLVALSMVTALEVARSAGDADAVRRQSELARAATGHRGLITALENERSWASSEVGGVEDSFESPVRGYDATRQETDAALSAFRAALTGKDRVVQDAFQPALDALSGLGQLRADIDAFAGPRTIGGEFPVEVYDRYAALLHPLLDANSQVVAAIDDVDLRQGAELVDLATHQAQVQADLTRLVAVGVLVRGGVTANSEIAAIARQREMFDRFNAAILDIGEPYDRLLAELYPQELADLTASTVDSALTTGTADVLTFLEGVESAHAAGYYGMRDQVVEALLARADDLVHQAEVRQQRYIVLAAVTLLAALATTWLVSRSITQPLRSLTRQATAMANHRLPESVEKVLGTPPGEDVAVPRIDPVSVRTRDEVFDVADALNRVQDTALDLAVEQAVLRRNIADSFTNLGRRNQNLLGRQLDFISELESNEADPHTLANLFRLDHLATRMRRNAESLLVLAGAEPPRQWGAPVPMTDVIRAALGEVEDYRRVAVRDVESALVVGAATADLAHLLAELVENALAFSPPDRNVEIRGRRRPSIGGQHAVSGRGPRRHDLPTSTTSPFGAAGLLDDQRDYTLAIIDSGLGMTPAEIDAANRRLAGAESFTIAPSKYLGHYVAGNLAARHGIRVHLESAAGSGVTAMVDVPSGALARAATRTTARGPVMLHESAKRRDRAALAPATPLVTDAGPDTWPPPLDHRLPGAQMPTTTPMVLRRAVPDQSDRRAPDDVYRFLTSYTAGVRRGVHDVRSRPPRPEP